jgi:CHAD domain-containing protein
MEAVQEVLGNHQDLVVADMWLADVVRDIDDSEEAFVAGRLDAIINLEREDVRGEWPRAWKAESRKAVRDWL